MQWTLPGTVLAVRREDADRVEEQFGSMFLAGGIVLSQVSNITGLEPYTIQNWVKRGFLSPPRRKRYTLRQLCRIININMLKSVLPMERICGLLGYINGQLDDESDDLIDDSVLYFMFVRLAAQIRQLDDPVQREAALDRVLEGYTEPIPGAKARIRQALRVMLIAWVSARMRQEAEALLNGIEKEV